MGPGEPESRVGGALVGVKELPWLELREPDGPGVEGCCKARGGRDGLPWLEVRGPCGCEVGPCGRVGGAPMLEDGLPRLSGDEPEEFGLLAIRLPELGVLLPKKDSIDFCWGSGGLPRPLEARLWTPREEGLPLSGLFACSASEPLRDAGSGCASEPLREVGTG